jgi:N-acetylglucosamine kinase-like BadF-type ATPase
LVKSILEGLTQAGLARARFEGAFLSLAGLGPGAWDPEIKLAMMAALKAKQLFMDNDGCVALQAAFLGEPGMVAIAGTGSAVLALDREGKVQRVGGWGHLLGDEGSAYRIAMDAIQASLQAHDGVREPTSLLEGMLSFFKWKEPREAIPFFYGRPLDKYAVARFAPLVVEEARRGDQVAREVVERNVAALAQAVRALAEKLDVPRRVAPVGGVLRSEYVRNLFTKRLSALGIALVPPVLPPVLGAVWLAMKETGFLTPKAVEELRRAAFLLEEG